MSSYEYTPLTSLPDCLTEEDASALDMHFGDDCLRFLTCVGCLFSLMRVSDGYIATKVDKANDADTAKKLSDCAQQLAEEKELVQGWINSADRAQEILDYVQAGLRAQESQLSEILIDLYERLAVLRRQEKAMPHTRVPEAGAGHLNVTEN